MIDVVGLGEVGEVWRFIWRSEPSQTADWLRKLGSKGASPTSLIVATGAWSPNTPPESAGPPAGCFAPVRRVALPTAGRLAGGAANLQRGGRLCVGLCPQRSHESVVV
jgi:hypothetical protein